jgi:glycerol-3-phosphate dehydrogenase
MIIFAIKKFFMNKKEYDLLIVGAGIYGASDDLGRRA